MRRTLHYLGAAALASSCARAELTDEQSQERADCFVGDPNAPLEVEPIYRTVAGEMAPLADGGDVPLILPPQGGKVFLVGVRARNLDVCSVRISAAVIDDCGGRVVARDGRPVFLVPDADGWAVPRQPHELSDYANVPACPSFGTDRDVNGEKYRLVLSIVDGGGRTVDLERQVVPICAEPQFAAQCECECDRSYILGRACEPEAVATPPPPVDPWASCPNVDGGTP